MLGGSHLRIVGLIGLVALIGAACGSTTSSPSAGAPATTAASAEPPASAPATASAPASAASGPATEITFWSWVPGIDAQVAAYNASQSAIHVNYLNAGAGNAEYTAFKTALETNTDVPDVVQIEYQHLPSFIVRGDLASLSDLGAETVIPGFEEWTVAQGSQGGAVYAYPQDAGPMIMMCNKALLDEKGVAVPTTWDEVTSASAALHKADPNAYLMNFTADQGHWFGLLWQAGARPFVVDGQNITIALTSPEANKVAKLWTDLFKSGNLSPIDTYTNDWNAALAAKQIACWTAGAWGPSLIESAAPDQKGDWQVYPMPQWDPATPINGNYGGSAIAVPAKSAHTAEGEAFARWLTSDAATALAVTGPPANLFPVTKSTLTNPEWTDFEAEFWGGQQTHKVMAEGATQVDTAFGWSPFTDYVYTTWEEHRNAAVAGTITFEQALKNLQDAAVAYAQEQGFTVK